jgi:hypothetical protein
MQNSFTIKEVGIAYDRDRYGDTTYKPRFFVERLEGNCLVDYGNYDIRAQAEKRIDELNAKF